MSETIVALPADVQERVSAAAGLLRAARRPLVTGLADATVEAQRRAVELAELLGGVIDPAGSAAHAAGTRAFQALGQVTATLGEARARADLLLFWGVDPEAVERGFTRRYLAPAGAPPRIVAVDVGEARGPAEADERLEVDPASEVEVLWALRASLKGRRLEPPPGAELRDWPPERVAALARRLAGCRYGMIFFDAAPPPERRDPLRPLALGALAMDANPGTHLRLVGLERPDNLAGAEAVLVWQTGYPSAIDFTRGYPRYAPGENEAGHVLAAGEVDAVLLVGTAPDLLPAARAALARLPVVVLGPAPAAEARVAIRTRSPEETPGSIYRMDGLPLRRRLTGPAGPLPTDEEVLAALVQAVRDASLGGGA